MTAIRNIDAARIDRLSDKDVGGVVQQGLEKAMQDPRILRAAGELLMDALKGNVKGLMNRVRSTADRGDTAYALIWQEMETAMIDRGLVEAPSPSETVAEGAAASTSKMAPAWSPSGLNTSVGELSATEVLDAGRSYAGLEDKTDHSVAHGLIKNRDALENVAGFLAVDHDKLRDYLVSGTWSTTPWKGRSLQNSRSINVPGEWLLRAHLQGAATEKLARTYDIDEAKLERYFDKRGWLEPAEVKYEPAAFIPDTFDVPKNLTWPLEGSHRALTPKEAIGLYATAQRITVDDAIAELRTHQPNGVAVRAIARYAGADNDAAMQWFEQGYWGNLGTAQTPLMSGGKKIDAPEVLSTYIARTESPNETAEFFLEVCGRGTGGSEFSPEGRAIRKTAEQLGVTSKDLLDYLSENKWNWKAGSKDEQTGLGRVFKEWTVKYDPNSDEPDVQSLNPDGWSRKPAQYLRNNSTFDAEDDPNFKNLETGIVGVLNVWTYNGDIKLSEPPQLLRPASFGIEEATLMRACLEGDAPAVHALLDAVTDAEAKAKTVSSKASAAFRRCLWFEHFTEVQGWYGSSPYDENQMGFVAPTSDVRNAIDNLDAKSVSALGDGQPLSMSADKVEAHSLLSLLSLESACRSEVPSNSGKAGRRGPDPDSALGKLEALEGLESVKRSLREVVALVKQTKARAEHGLSPVPMSLHARFEGNPGTGKTTVARLYGEALKDAGVLSKGHVVEVGGAELLSGGLKAIEEKIEEAEGGVLIIDELYQIDPKSNPKGREIANFLLKAMEDKRDDLVVIGTGYSKEMEEFIGWNDGFKRRFAQTMGFEDYDDRALERILSKMAGEHGYQIDPVLIERCIRRVARGRGPGFGNAGAARNAFETAVRRQGLRLDQAEEDGVKLTDSDYKTLITDDILGPEYKNAFGELPALDALMKLEGLDDVKEQAQALVDMIRLNAQREELGQPSVLPPLHAVFAGNPGTGKTTVAKLYGRILKELGYLSKGDVMVVTREDLCGSVVGETEKKTKAVLERARGKVLVIDEAYSLHSKLEGDYGRVAIDTIVANVQGTPGEDICVIMTGYEQQMEEMLRKSNPGLSRRMAQSFPFKDYDNKALAAIMELKAEGRGFNFAEGAVQAAIKVLSRERVKPNFGNAGAVDNMLGAAEKRQSSRLANQDRRATSEELRTLTAWDLVGDVPEPGAAGAGLDDMIGLDSVKEKIEEYRALLEEAQQRGDDPLEYFEPAFVFKGGPGTGKTTVAREMGRVFHELGFLASDEVVEVSAADLIAGFQGQTASKTLDVLQSALGKTLIIDEAYGLADPRNSYSKEAIEQLLKFVSDHRGEFAIILAGYNDDMDGLLDRNDGLRRRFSEHLQFEDYTPAQCGELLQQKLSEKSFALSDGATKALPELMSRLTKAPGFGNAGDALSLMQKVVRKQAVRLRKTKNKDRNTIVSGDLKAGLKDLLATKRSEVHAPRAPVAPEIMAVADAGQEAPRVTAKADHAHGHTHVEGAHDHDHGPTDPRVAALIKGYEKAFADAGVKLEDALAALKSGSVPADILKAVADALGMTPDDVMEMTGEVATEIQEIVEQAEANKTSASEWICGFCGNANPGCPYRAEQVGGFYRDTES